MASMICFRSVLIDLLVQIKDLPTCPVMNLEGQTPIDFSTAYQALVTNISRYSNQTTPI